MLAAQLPVRPRAVSRTATAKTCRAPAERDAPGRTTDATSRPGRSGTATAYSRTGPADCPPAPFRCGSATALVVSGPDRQSGAVSS